MQVRKNFKCIFDTNKNSYVEIVCQKIKWVDYPVFIKWHRLNSTLVKSAKEREYLLEHCVFRMLSTHTIHTMPVVEIKNPSKVFSLQEILLLEKHLYKSPTIVQQELFPHRSYESVKACMRRLKQKEALQ